MHRVAKDSLDRLLLQVVDGSLAGAIFIVPLLMGGRHAVGQLVLTALAVAAGWAWAVRQCIRRGAPWRHTWAAPLLAAGLMLALVQILPMPPALLAWLAPHTAEILPQANAAATFPAMSGNWHCVSFTPAETQMGLVLFLDFILLFFVVVQRITHIEDVERLLRWTALSAMCIAVLGIGQMLTGTDKFFGFYQHPFSLASDGAHGSFSNRNHFAHFLALGIGPLIWWLQDTSRHRGNESKTYLLGLALGILLFAGLLSLSRGGIAVMFLAAALCTAVCYRASSVGGRFVGILAASGLLIGVSLGIFGFDRVSNRLEDLSSGSLERLDNSACRRNIWAAAAKAVPDHILLGAGVGSFAEVYPMYTGAIRDEDIEFTHAENSYLQIPVETGLLGLALVLAGIVLIAWWCIQGIRPTVATRMRLCAAAISGSMAAAVTHAIVDFVWYVPACMAIVAILAACALRIKQISANLQICKSANQESRTSNPDPSPFFPIFWPATATALTLFGAWMIASGVGPALAQPHWDAYLFTRRTAQIQSPAALADVQWQRQQIARLENVVRWQPTHARAHLALAESHRRLFDSIQAGAENRMSLANIRDAAIQSKFPSREALSSWLTRAIGKHWQHLELSLYHTRQALGLCPLQGRAYVYLAELSFLQGADAAVKQACVQQALRVRPFDGPVLYAAAMEFLLAGDTVRWLDYCKQAFRTSRPQQQRFINDLAASTPSENLPGLIDFVIREFQPDLDGLRLLYDACCQRCSPEQLASLTRYRAQQAEAKASGLELGDAANVWIEAQQFHLQLNDELSALRCARRAVECDPGNYNARQQLAYCLLRQRLYAESESHLRWCLQRMPNDRNMEMKFREALKGRLDSQGRAAIEGNRK